MTAVKKLTIRTLVLEWQGPIYRYLLLRLGNEADAADATQETFILALERLDQLRDPDRVRPWLYQIAHNAAARQRRSRGRRRAHESAGARCGSFAPEASGLDEADERRWIRDQVSELPIGLREPIALHYFQGLTQHEVAAALGLPRSTVQSRLNKGLGQLKSLCGSRAVAPLLSLGADAAEPLPAALSRALQDLTASGLRAAVITQGAIAMKIKFAALGAALILIGLAAGVSIGGSLNSQPRSPELPTLPRSEEGRFEARIAALEAERAALSERLAARQARAKAAPSPASASDELAAARREIAALKAALAARALEERAKPGGYEEKFMRLLSLYSELRAKKPPAPGTRPDAGDTARQMALSGEITTLSAQILAKPEQFAATAVEVLEGPASAERSALLRLVRGGRRLLSPKPFMSIAEAVLAQLQSGGIAAEDHAAALRVLRGPRDEAFRQRALSAAILFLSDQDDAVFEATVEHLIIHPRAEVYEALADVVLNATRPGAANKIVGGVSITITPVIEPSLLRMATHRDPALRSRIYQKMTYAESLNPDTIRALSQRFHSESDPRVLAAIVQALAAHGDASQAPILEHAAERSADPELKKQLERAIQRIRKRAKGS